MEGEADDGQDEAGPVPLLPAGEEGREIDDEGGGIKSEGGGEEGRFRHDGLLASSKIRSNSASNASRLLAARPAAVTSTLPCASSRTTRISRDGQ